MIKLATVKERELKNISKQMKIDKKNVRTVKSIYADASKEVEEMYAAFYGRYSNSDTISMVESRQKATKKDIAQYKRDVEKANLTPRGKEEEQSSRSTVNRLELLKARVNLELIQAAEEEERLLEEILVERAEREYRRQAVIIGVALLVGGRWLRKHPKEAFKDGVPRDKFGGKIPHIAYTKKSLLEIINTRLDSAYGRTVKSVWSHNLWTNQRELRRQLETILERGMIAGRNPRAMARELRSKISSSVYNSERLLRTESAFTQGQVAIDSMKQNGIKRYIWIAEETACDECSPLDGKTFSIEESEDYKKMIPKHPNCLCSISSYVPDRAEWEQSMRARGLYSEEELKQKV